MWKKLTKKYKYSLILLRELVRADFKVKYQDSILGYLWSILKPLFMFAILYAVFVRVLRVGRGVEDWPIALLTGVMLWQFFVDVASGSLKSIVSNGSLLRKIKFPRYIIVMSGTVSAFITLAINSIVVVLFAVVSGVRPSWSLLWVVPLVVQLFVFALGIAFFLSAAYVKFRDLKYIWDVVSQGLFYGSAIIYPVSFIVAIGDNGRLLAQAALANPAAQTIQDIRHIAINQDVPSLWTITGGSRIAYLLPIGVTILTFAFGAWFFRKRSAYFAEDV